MRPSFYGVIAVMGLFSLSGCSKLGEFVQGSGSAQVDHRRVLQTPANFDIALKENQAALGQNKPAPDIALFNIGVILAHPSNPKKDSSRALLSFKALVKEHPQSALLEPSKTWIQVLELQQEVDAERRNLAEEKRALSRDREALAREREKLDYANQKSLQLDLEIEKRRRSLRK
jgi:Skp family chaperone for outer membrane proteins